MKDIIAIVLFFGGLIFAIGIIIRILFIKNLEQFRKTFNLFIYAIITMAIGLIIGTF